MHSGIIRPGVWGLGWLLDKARVPSRGQSLFLVSFLPPATPRLVHNGKRRQVCQVNDWVNSAFSRKRVDPWNGLCTQW